jgi:peptidoglycan/LPS O-acetylase OafA/YrhL
MRYRDDIDGLRSLAVLPIVLFHAGIGLISGGFIGVDVFFVISGFLITTIIRADLEAGRFSILTFYERRARRILPALFFTLTLTTLVAAILFLPSYFADYARSLLSTATFTSNIYFWKFSGYFDSSAQLRPLLHTWSLAVEEQFYIIVPVAMYLVHRFIRRAEMAVLLVALFGSLGLSLHMTEVGPTANFLLLPTRAWELLVGGFVALLPARVALRGPANQGAALLALAVMIAPMLLYTEATPFPGLAALPPCLGAALLIWTGRSKATLVSRALAWSPLVAIGRMSYSLYLVHWPVTVFMLYVTLRRPDALQVASILGLSFALAWISLRFVEQPFRDRRLLATRRPLFAAGLAGFAAFALVGAAIDGAQGFPGRFPRFAATMAGATPSSKASWNDGACFFEDDWAYDGWAAENCEITSNGDAKALLWGDSYAAHYAPGLAANAAGVPYRLFQYTQAVCPPVLSYDSYARPGCRWFNQNALKIIDDLGIDTVILSARWVDLRSRGIGTLAATVEALQAKGVEVMVIGQSPMFVTDVPVIALQKSQGGDSDSWPTVIEPHLNEELRAASGSARFIDPIAAACGGAACPYRSKGGLLYYDAGHFTDFGSAEAVRSYFPAFVPKLTALR